MKKLLLLSIFLFLCVSIVKVEALQTHNTFQEIEMHQGKLLRYFTDAEYNKYYKKIEKRKFFGWRVYKVNDNVRATFISETIFSYHNNGTTPITYEYSLSESLVKKVSTSTTGSLGYKMSGKNDDIKFDLASELELDHSNTTTNTTTETKKLNIVIDPHSVANLKIVGEGRVINGVGAYYILWIQVCKGGFEYFIVTTQYPRLEVLPI